jgi:hypothetical protein
MKYHSFITQNPSAAEYQTVSELKTIARSFGFPDGDQLAGQNAKRFMTEKISTGGFRRTRSPDCAECLCRHGKNCRSGIVTYIMSATV